MRQSWPPQFKNGFENLISFSVRIIMVNSFVNWPRTSGNWFWWKISEQSYASKTDMRSRDFFMIVHFGEMLSRNGKKPSNQNRRNLPAFTTFNNKIETHLNESHNILKISPNYYKLLYLLILTMCPRSLIWPSQFIINTIIISTLCHDLTI